MLKTTLFKALHLSSHEEKGFGEFRSFEINPSIIKDTNFTCSHVDNTGIYGGCRVYQTTSPIKLSTRWSGGGRPFLYGDKKIDLPAGSYIYAFPEGHQVYGLDHWTRFEVTPIKE